MNTEPTIYQQGRAVRPAPANCVKAQEHGAYWYEDGTFWHDLPGSGWTCVAWECLPHHKEVEPDGTSV